MDLNKENIKKIRGLIVFTLVVLIGLWKYEVAFDLLRFIFHIFFPFLLGGAIAFVFNVPMHFIETHLFSNRVVRGRRATGRLARPFSLLLTIILVLGMIGLVMFVVAPQLGKTVMGMGSSIQEFVTMAQAWARDAFRNNEEAVAWISSIEFNWDKLIQGSMDFFRNGAGSVLDSTYAAAKSIVSGVASFAIAFVFSCYVLLQKERLNVQVKKIAYAFMPRVWIEILLEICAMAYKTCSGFLTGQCVEAVILGTMFLITMTIFGFPYALLVGVLIGFTALIPVFGAFIGCFFGTFLILMEDPMQALGFIVLFLVLQQIEGNLIYPHVVGSSVGLPSIWVLAAVSIGGSLMGIVGMLIFIPISSVIYSLFRGIVHNRLKRMQITVDEEGVCEFDQSNYSKRL